MCVHILGADVQDIIKGLPHLFFFVCFGLTLSLSSFGIHYESQWREDLLQNIFKRKKFWKFLWAKE
jgi:hypothetical protein